MDSETAAALIGAGAGIIGALVGGGGAVLAARVTAGRGAEAMHEPWHIQGRRDAYSQLILVAQSMLEDIFSFRKRALEGLVTPHSALEAYSRLAERMGEIRAAHVAAEMAGPEGIDRHTGRVLRSLLGTVEAMRPEAMVEAGHRWNLSDAFEGAFADADRAVSDMSWCARQILSTPGIARADGLRPPLADSTG